MPKSQQEPPIQFGIESVRRSIHEIREPREILSIYSRPSTKSKVNSSDVQKMLRLRLLLLQEKNFFIAFRNLKSLLNENCIHNLRNGASMSGSVASVAVRFFLRCKVKPFLQVDVHI